MCRDNILLMRLNIDPMQGRKVTESGFLLGWANNGGGLRAL
jgi:hypothetical protein